MIYTLYSYAMYVLHIFVKQAIAALTESIILPRYQQMHGAGHIPPIAVALFVLGANLGASYLLAVASWHLFEKHFLRLKKYFPYQVRSLVSSEAEASAKLAMAE
jgi:peptidoglycan/LPS O-acetylase OafA/YrhL